MIAISLHQPWASAIAAGLKCFETRSWPAAWRGPMAIQAAKRDQGDQRAWWMQHVKHAPDERGAVIAEAFARIGIRDWCDLPFGRIVCTCELAAVHLTEELVDGRLKRHGTPMEFLWGNFAPERYAWEITHVVALENPPAAKGWQNFFTWDPVTGVTKGMAPARRGAEATA